MENLLDLVIASDLVTWWCSGLAPLDSSHHIF